MLGRCDLATAGRVGRGVIRVVKQFRRYQAFFDGRRLVPRSAVFGVVGIEGVGG